MAEQYLNRPQVCAGFEHVRGVAMAKGVRCNPCVEASRLHRITP